MRSTWTRLWVFASMTILGFWGCSDLSLAGPITVKIDNMNPSSPSSGTCSNSNTCINIGGTYGVLQVTPEPPVSGTCGSSSCARVDVPILETQGDSLRVTNTRITNTGSSSKTFVLMAEREDVSLPGSGSYYYNTDTAGFFGPAAGNKIISKSFYRPNGGSYGQVGATYTYTVSCQFGQCTTPFNNPPTGAPRSVNVSPRWVKIELTITLQPNSFIVFSPGNRLVSESTPPVDGMEVLPPSNPCPTCTPRAQLSLFCATTHSTAKAFGCPSCVAEDAVATQEQKFKLFASTNWDNLLQDIARGDGEYLASLAALLKIPPEHRATFFSNIQTQRLTFTQDTIPTDQQLSNLYGIWQSIYQ